jgi:hypothetical protein
MQPTDIIFKDLKEQGRQLGEGRTRRIFMDRGSKILFVAHLDTVCQPRMAGEDMQGRQHGAGFDDRLGCKIAWQLGSEFECDVLLTDLEESGDSTAQHHELKNYNWICEFDRAGDDVVTYGMESERWLSVLGKYWDVHNGMFSDISFMKTECCAMNLGIGYEHAHSDNSYYDIAVVNEQIKLFRHFFAKQCNNKYIADPSRRDYMQSVRYGFGDYVGGYYEEEFGCCCVCGNYADESIYELHLCEDCIDRMVEQEIRI